MNTHLTLNTLDDYTIAAVHTIASRKRILLWLHGITVNKDEYLDFFKDGAEYLANKDFDSLRIDFRGHGSSSGSSLDFSIVGQMLDVDCAMSFISKTYSRNIPVYIVGCSFGAPPAIYTALNYPKLVKGIVLISPVISYRRTFLEPETHWGKSIFNKKALSLLSTRKELRIDNDFHISPRLIEEMKIIRPDLALKDVKQSVTIIHGDADSMVPYAAAKDVANEIVGIKFFSMSRMDHGFMDKKDECGTSEKSQNNKIRIFDIISENCL